MYITSHACFFISLCLLFASVGQASARTNASLPWILFTSLLTHRLVLLCIDASALGLDRCNTSLSLSLSLSLAVLSLHGLPGQVGCQGWCPGCDMHLSIYPMWDGMPPSGRIYPPHASRPPRLACLDAAVHRTATQG